MSTRCTPPWTPAGISSTSRSRSGRPTPTAPYTILRRGRRFRPTAAPLVRRQRRGDLVAWPSPRSRGERRPRARQVRRPPGATGQQPQHTTRGDRVCEPPRGDWPAPAPRLSHSGTGTRDTTMSTTSSRRAPSTSSSGDSAIRCRKTAGTRPFTSSGSRSRVPLSPRRRLARTSATVPRGDAPNASMLPRGSARDSRDVGRDLRGPRTSSTSAERPAPRPPRSSSGVIDTCSGSKPSSCARASSSAVSQVRPAHGLQQEAVASWASGKRIGSFGARPGSGWRTR